MFNTFRHDRIKRSVPKLATQPSALSRQVRISEGRQPTVVVNVVLQHLVLQDTAELRQGFQVDDVDD